MQPPSGDAAEYAFFTMPGSHIEGRLVSVPSGQELQLFGNRAGLLSLANVLLWFLANAWRREFFSLGELDFVNLQGQLAVCLRLTEAEADGTHGVLHRLDQGELLEWTISEDGLQQVALWMHRLVSGPAHEDDRLLVAEASEYGVHVRMTDAAEWVSKGVA